MIKQKRVNGQPELSRDHCHRPAPGTALDRHPHVVKPLSAVVAHAAAAHHHQHIAASFRADQLFASEWVSALTGGTDCHDCKIADIDQHGTLPRIELQHRLGVIEGDVRVA